MSGVIDNGRVDRIRKKEQQEIPYIVDVRLSRYHVFTLCSCVLLVFIFICSLFKAAGGNSAPNVRAMVKNELEGIGVA